MPICPSCGSEFRAGITDCNTCHVALVDSLDPPQAEVEVVEEVDEETLHLLGTFNDDAQAILMRHLLDGAGIPSIVQGGHGPRVGHCVPYRVLVDEDYVEAAQETIAAYQSPSLITGQVEGDLARLSTELNRLARERRDLVAKIQSNDPYIKQVRVGQNRPNVVRLVFDLKEEVKPQVDEVVFPDGKRETILSVPEYNWHWQLWYNLAEPVDLPQGTKIECTAHFDNSPNNPENPDPTKSVIWGQQSWDEMMVGFFNLKFDATMSAKELSAPEGAIHVH